MPPAPVRIRQRISMPRSSPGIASAIPFSVSWSRAFRESGRLRVSRATASAGSSRSSFPPASSVIWLRLFEDDQDVALGDRLALLTADLGHLPRILGFHRHLHLHRLQDHNRVTLVDLVPHGHLDLPDGAGDVRFHVGHGRGQYPPVTAELDRVVIVAAHNEADRIEPTLDALAEVLPGARLIVADDASTDGTRERAMAHGAWLISRRGRTERGQTSP